MPLKVNDNISISYSRIDSFYVYLQRVGVYRADIGQLVINPQVQISWPGGDGPVEDIPECGFNDMLCEQYTEKGDGSSVLIDLLFG